MKTSLWVLAILAIGLAMPGKSQAAWCTAVTDNNCGDNAWGTLQYTIPQDVSAITIRYESGNPDCCVDVEVWALENVPPTREFHQENLCNCGVVTYSAFWNAGHVLLFKVKCHISPDYNGSENPCNQLSPEVRFYWPSNNITCNTQCIPD